MSDIENQIGFEQLGLGSVLKQNQLSVPANQRDYSWSEREVTKLFQDFAKAISDNERYFLGTIVTIPRQAGALEVVDGQQRLATTAILLAEIRNYLCDREPVLAESIENEFLTGIDRVARGRMPRLRLNLDDNDYFRSRLVGKDAAPIPTHLSHERLDSAFKNAKAQVKKIIATFDEKDHGDTLNAWISFIEKRALVVLLRVPDDANAYRMFETLNDRGLRTSQSDLVKNYLFGKSGDRLQEVQQKWALMRGALESLDDDDITVDFLRHALTVIRGPVRESEVYEAVQEIAKGAQAAVSFANNLESLANTYVAIQNPEHEKWNKYSDSTRRAIEVLNLLDIRPMRPLMLAVAQKFNEKESEQTFKFLTSLGVRLLVASSTRSGSVETPLAAASNKVFTAELDTADKLKKALAALVPNDQEFKQAFEIATLSSAKLARYYLRSLEMAARGESEPWHIPNDDRQTINLEHVLPQKPETLWPQFNEDEIRLYYRRIGNLALLRASENSDLKSRGFDAKKEVYVNCPYVLTKQIADEVKWDAAQISVRQKKLAEFALKAWQV